MKLDWKLATPLDAFIFDCDGTLSDIEGIDELAGLNGCRPQVAALTQEAMSKSGLNPELYEHRLALIHPTEKQMTTLSDLYYGHITPEADAVIHTLQRLSKKIYVITAGLAIAVTGFIHRLNIPKQNVFAVDIQFNQQGNFLSFDKSSPLITPLGKRIFVEKLNTMHSRIAYIGDGMNDLIVKDLVTRFIGYGGAYYRGNIESECSYYIRSHSLSGLLPLCLTSNESMQLTSAEKIIYQQGLNDILKGEIKVN